MIEDPRDILDHKHEKILKYPYLESAEAIAWLLGLTHSSFSCPNMPLNIEDLKNVQRNKILLINRGYLLGSNNLLNKFKTLHESLKKEITNPKSCSEHYLVKKMNSLTWKTFIGQQAYFISPLYAIFFALRMGLLLPDSLQNILGIDQFDLRQNKKVFPKALEKQLKIQAKAQIAWFQNFHTLKYSIAEEVSRDFSFNCFHIYKKKKKINKEIKQILREVDPVSPIHCLNLFCQKNKINLYFPNSRTSDLTKDLPDWIKCLNEIWKVSDQKKIERISENFYEKLKIWTKEEINRIVIPPIIFDSNIKEKSLGQKKIVDFCILRCFLQYLYLELKKKFPEANQDFFVNHTIFQYYQNWLPKSISDFVLYSLNNINSTIS